MWLSFGNTSNLVSEVYSCEEDSKQSEDSQFIDLYNELREMYSKFIVFYSSLPDQELTVDEAHEECLNSAENSKIELEMNEAEFRDFCQELNGCDVPNLKKLEITKLKTSIQW